MWRYSCRMIPHVDFNPQRKAISSQHIPCQNSENCWLFFLYELINCFLYSNAKRKRSNNKEMVKATFSQSQRDIFTLFYLISLNLPSEETKELASIYIWEKLDPVNLVFVLEKWLNSSSKWIHFDSSAYLVSSTADISGLDMLTRRGVLKLGLQQTRLPLSINRLIFHYL